MVNKPLIRPYFWGGYVRGGRLTSHKISWWFQTFCIFTSQNSGKGSNLTIQYLSSGLQPPTRNCLEFMAEMSLTCCWDFPPKKKCVVFLIVALENSPPPPSPCFFGIQHLLRIILGDVRGKRWRRVHMT